MLEAVLFRRVETASKRLMVFVRHHLRKKAAVLVTCNIKADLSDSKQGSLIAMRERAFWIRPNVGSQNDFHLGRQLLRSATFWFNSDLIEQR